MRTLSFVRGARPVSCALALGLLALPVARPAAADRDDERKRIADSTEVVAALVRAPDQGIPGYILERAEAVVVIPSLVKGGFIVGAQHGKGVMSVRDRAANSWSTPGFVSMTGGSLGWQIGVQAVDLVLLVMNREGIKNLLDTEFKLGANASVAAGPVGRQGEASTDAKLSAEILAYSRAKGLFAGLTLEGAALRNDKDANQRFYGTAVSTQDLVHGLTVSATPEGLAFTSAFARAASAAHTN
jgi:lipid-binding SYLF domain-containing protein